MKNLRFEGIVLAASVAGRCNFYYFRFSKKVSNNFYIFFSIRKIPTVFINIINYKDFFLKLQPLGCTVGARNWILSAVDWTGWLSIPTAPFNQKGHQWSFKIIKDIF